MLCGWVGNQRKSKNRHFVFQEPAVCPKSFDIPSVGCVANAGLAGLSVRPACHSRHQPILPACMRPSRMLSGDDHHDNGTRGSLSGRQRVSHPPEGLSMMNDGQHTPTIAQILCPPNAACHGPGSGRMETKPTVAGVESLDDAPSSFFSAF